MASLPEILFGESSTGSRPYRLSQKERARRMAQLITALKPHETREQALQILSSDREIRDHVAPLLWHSTGTVTILLEEILLAYRELSTPNLDQRTSTRVSHVLALFQMLATDPDTRMPFIKASMPSYVYPFMVTKARDKSHEFLRATSLAVVAALAKSEDPAAIRFLLESEAIPGCLNSLEIGSDLSKTVAALTISKILLKEEGLRYFSTLAERFYALCRALGQVTDQLVREPSLQLLKFVITCYLQLSEFPRLSEGLKYQFPPSLLDNTFASLLQEDLGAIRSLERLVNNVKVRCFREEQIIDPGYLI